jgi:hypothetical protein
MGLGGSTPRFTDGLIVSRNMNLYFDFDYLRGTPCVEAGSNTSTVVLRVVGGDEKGDQCLGI